jgi:alpha-L-fucosidase
MFDSKASKWNIVQATPYGKDPLMALAEECRKQGMKLGFYYSQDQDWNNGGSAAHGGHWDKAQDRDLDDYVDKIAVPQVTELLTNYGKETPAVLWWDTPMSLNEQQAGRIEAVVQKLRPDLIQNNRLCHVKDATGKKIFPGDTETPEQFIPPQGYPGRDWETCMTMNGHWGYNAYDQKWKSTEDLIRNVCDIASKGGNYLLNVGPTSLGEIPPECIKRLAEVGEWMKVNNVAIYGSGPTPFNIIQGAYDPVKKDKKGKPIFVPEWKWRAITKPGHVYLVIFAWPENGTYTIPALKQKISGAALLADPSVKLSVTQDEKGTTISGLPEKTPDAVATVIDLKY